MQNVSRFFDCNVCGESVCKCGNFVSCECSREWCSDECAEVDGFERGSCRFGYDMDDKEEHGCTEKYCENCDNFVEAGCKYCREEDFEDDVLLEYVLDKHLNMSRQELIDNYKLYKGGL